ncbi:hypothetical protein [Desulfuromonas thiophila]|uniref:Uncharacterized protein n=1 Tax=Desulfuromonas thiophila TaxID=57664 RepID=A0A1G7B325_9BACT|nr:hypothetical protein [Desulfuromonas thiophila]SDE21508.1 hypothetical protein SAMN05661003_10544 [Desulfuromonas thiophila]
MINLGEAQEQKEHGGAGQIPPKSLVKVRLEIRKPKKADPQDAAVTICSSGLKGLDCEFTVVSGRFEGSRIWENIFLPPAMQSIQLTKGQEGVCNGGFARCRAIIEAARGIDPDDPAGNRNINSWFDLHGLEFPAKVGVDKPKAGDQYVNNNIAKVLTVKDEEFKTVMGGGEVITDEPLPEIPAGAPAGAGSVASGPPAGWGQQAPPPGDSDAPPAKQKQNVPAWAQ